MKKIIATLMIIAAVSSLSAQTYTKGIPAENTTTGKTVSNVPAAVLANYNAMYPGANTIKWTWKDHTYYVVVFVYNGEKMKAMYLTNGTYVG